MDLKLKSILKETPWWLLAKAVFLTVVWFWLPWWLFVVVTVWLFYKEEADPDLSYNRTFWSLIILSGAFKFLPEYVWYLPVTIIFVGLILLMGLRHMFFVRKLLVYRGLHLVLFLGLLVFLFWALFFTSYLFYFYLLFVVLAYFLMAELARVAVGERYAVFWGGLATFILAQIVWGMSLLPIEFVNKAAIAFLVVVVIQEFLLRGERGKQAGPNFYLTLTSSFTVLFLIVLLFSSWGVV